MKMSFKEDGFQLEKLGHDVIDDLKETVSRDFVRVLKNYGYSGNIIEKSIRGYGDDLQDAIHKSIWKKSNRMLGSKDVKALMGGQFYADLSNVVGDFRVTDEEGIGYGNIYWRIVRPGRIEDVGPIHRDEWFWDLNPTRKEECQGYNRIKCWIPLQSEKNKNLLMVERGSHKREDLVYRAAFRDGINKPIFDLDINSVDMQMLSMEYGDAVFFHDRLLHCGSFNRGNLARVSIELTLLI